MVLHRLLGAHIQGQPRPSPNGARAAPKVHASKDNGQPLQRSQRQMVHVRQLQLRMHRPGSRLPPRQFRVPHGWHSGRPPQPPSRMLPQARRARNTMETGRVERRVPLPTMPRHQVGQDPGGDHRLAPPAAQRRSQGRSPQQAPTRKTLPRERPRKGLARPHAGPSAPRRMVATTKMVVPESTHPNSAASVASLHTTLSCSPEGTHTPSCATTTTSSETWDAPKS